MAPMSETAEPLLDTELEFRLEVGLFEFRRELELEYEPCRESKAWSRHIKQVNNLT